MRQEFFRRSVRTEKSFHSPKNSSRSSSGTVSMEGLLGKGMLAIVASSPLSSGKYHCTYSAKVLRYWEIGSFSNWSSPRYDSSITLHHFSKWQRSPGLLFCVQFYSLKTILRCFENVNVSLLTLQFQIMPKSVRISVLLIQHTTLVYAAPKIRAFSKLLRLFFATPQPPVRDQPIGNHGNNPTFLPNISKSKSIVIR